MDMSYDIRKLSKEDIERINASLNSGKTVELKPEKTGLAIVEIWRQFLYKKLS